MQERLQNQPQIKILPAFCAIGQTRLRDEDINEMVKTVQDVLPQEVDGDIDLTITILEKNLKIMADIALMKEALSHLVRNTIDAMPGCGKLSLTINQVNYEIESLLNGDNSTIGACAFIAFAREITDARPFITAKTDGNGLSLTIAYRIIKQHHGRINTGNQMGQRTEVNVYLPLTKTEIVQMLSIPAV